jgi:hypothetical protein
LREDAAVAIVNITVENDADFFRQFQYVTIAAGAAIDITGTSLEMMLRRHAGDETALLRLATDTGEFVLVDPVNGLFSLFIAQAVLEQLGLGSYDHSLIMTKSTFKTRIWSGTLLNNPGATR